MQERCTYSPIVLGTCFPEAFRQKLRFTLKRKTDIKESRCEKLKIKDSNGFRF